VESVPCVAAVGGASEGFKGVRVSEALAAYVDQIN
jgi:hypothetical protein